MSLLRLPSPVRSFLHEHDDLPAFHAAYLLFTLLAAALLSAGVFAVLMAVHMLFDLYKYHTKERLPWNRTIRATARESLPDVTLLTLVLTFAVYLNHSAEAMAGLSGLLHSEVSIVRALTSVLPKFGIGKRLIDVMAKGHPQFLGHGKHLKDLTMFEWVCAGGFAFLILLLLIAPRLLLVDPVIEQEIILEHLRPWRM
jgi:hypothetical protein